MPVINNPFNGKLNLDVAEYRISNGDYIDALNITKDAQGRGQDRVVSNILGNTLIPYTLPEGTNKIIGFYPDKVRNRAYYFLWNSNGYDTILYYDLSNDTITKVLENKTDSDGVDILNFNPSYKILSVNIFYRDLEGDILFFNDGFNPPKNININDDYGTYWKLEYILVAKAPPVMPPRVVYENDENVTINNLRNKLFQFCYRFVYTNNEKSVWSTKSIVPLPQQPSINLTEDIFTNNSRISISIFTGGVDVKYLELSFRETTNGNTSDWFLIRSLNKLDNGIESNSIYTYNFYNDSVYTQIDILESSQLQDYVPQRANAAELANGNVLLYAGITEGYNKTSMNLVSSSQKETSGYYFDKCGLSFFATCNGLDSGSDGTLLKIYLNGTGENTNNIVSELNNAAGVYMVNVYNNSESNIGISYTNNSNVISVNSLLTSISSEFTGNGNGWTQVSLVDNVLTLSNSSNFKLLSSGVRLLVESNDPLNTTFANAWDSGYQYAIQYFDKLGRTIGAQTYIDASFNTQSSDGFKYPITSIQIKNRPPLEAFYYQVLRSNNTTYAKRLFWVSDSAYQSYSYIPYYVFSGSTTTTTTSPVTTTTTNAPKFVYIGVGNIQQYNDSITSTQNVVSYSFTEGDRIRFLSNYNVNNVETPLDEYNLDYEIVGTESSIVTPDGSPISGNFIKIRYPYDDIRDNFRFEGTANYFHYKIFVYNYISSSSNEKLFYEFGKCFGIGNPSTNLSYHLGLDQTQSSSNPINVPAIVSATNGDLFYRKRTVPNSDLYVFPPAYGTLTGGGMHAIYVNITFNPSIGIIENDLYKLINPAGGGGSLDPSGNPGSPLYSDDRYFFLNKSTTETLKLNMTFTGTITDDAEQIPTNGFYCIICTPNGSRIKVSIGKTGENINTSFDIPPLGKLMFTAQSNGNGDVSTSNINFSVIKSNTIDIIEQSFSDNYNLVTNSNGRPSVVEENARQTYFPTLIRFGGAYQVNTNINQINNFKYENFDEYDRSFGDVLRLHVRDRYLKVYQKFKVGNVPILTQIVKDSANNPLQANTDTLINKIQYYAGDYGIGDAATSLAWNNFSDYFVDNYRGVVCRLSQDGITPLSILYNTNAFFVPLLQEYRQELNNGVPATGQVYTGNPCIYGVFDAYTNKYIIAMEEINRYYDCNFNGGTATSYPTPTTSTTTTTTLAPAGYRYRVSNYYCDSCAYYGGSTGWTNSEPLTVGKYYSFAAYYSLGVVYIEELLEVLPPQSYYYNISDSTKKDTCAEVGC